MSETRCIDCDLTEDEHHPFFAASVPNGCVCDPREWNDPRLIPPACAAHQGPRERNCANCEHDAECHPSADQGIRSHE